MLTLIRNAHVYQNAYDLKEKLSTLFFQLEFKIMILG